MTVAKDVQSRISDVETLLRPQMLSKLTRALLRAEAAYEDITNIHRPKSFLAFVLREANLQALPLTARPPDHSWDDTARRDVLRPVSMRSLAQSLHVPVQTCHESVEALCESGLVKRTSSGLVIDYSANTTSRFEKADFRSYRVFYDFLAEGWVGEHWSDIVQGMPAPDSELPAWRVHMCMRPWLRWVCRIFESYVPLFGDPQALAVGAAVIALQRPSMNDWTGGRVTGAYSNKVSSLAVAQMTTMPRETVRRRLHDLAARGMIYKGQHGWRFSLALRDGDTLSLERIQPFLGSFGRLATELRAVATALKTHAETAPGSDRG